MSQMPLYSQRGISIERGQGAIVWDSNGKEYIDCVGGIAVASIGHANSAITSALIEQSRKIITVSGAFSNSTRDKFIETLTSITPQGMDSAFICNSGTEAVEAAIKFARYTTKKKKFIAAVRAFHGRTMGALSATHSHDYKEPFMPLVEGFTHVPYNNAQKLEEAMDSDVAAIILEPIQGEGGVIIGQQEYFSKARELCDKHNALLIYDEIQTGFCRTGTMFYSEQLGVYPDIMCLAKAIAGGLPMGAVVCNDKVEAPTGKHGTTFGGNPLVCAAGIAALKFMHDNNLSAEAERKGNMIMNALKELNSPRIREVRGKGLLIGIEFKEKSKPIVDALAQRGVLAMPTGPRVIRLLPPLVIKDNEIEKVIMAIKETLE
jgi:LysW-gamma-L-lysine/LysW-L-ornithine aminotransferase